jgi:hypothetical protein
MILLDQMAIPEIVAVVENDRNTSFPKNLENRHLGCCRRFT